MLLTFMPSFILPLVGLDGVGVGVEAGVGVGVGFTDVPGVDEPAVDSVIAVMTGVSHVIVAPLVDTLLPNDVRKRTPADAPPAISAEAMTAVELSANAP
jgi:hypothetical protein